MVNKKYAKYCYFPCNLPWSWQIHRAVDEDRPRQEDVPARRHFAAAEINREKKIREKVSRNHPFPCVRSILPACLFTLHDCKSTRYEYLRASPFSEKSSVGRGWINAISKLNGRIQNWKTLADNSMTTGHFWFLRQRWAEDRKSECRKFLSRRKKEKQKKRRGDCRSEMTGPWGPHLSRRPCRIVASLVRSIA